ncbi:MAG: glutamate formimidoyltransferase [Solirubrobacteraceae bacterium]
MAVPNVSEGRSAPVLRSIAQAFTRGGVRLLDRHADPDHHRAVFTLAGRPGELAEALLAGAREAIARIDLQTPRGLHPHLGALDIVPIVYLHPDQRGAACAEALLAAELIGSQLELPVYMYGDLAGGRTRAELRAGGLSGVAARALRPEFGPIEPHPSAGAALVGARPPLIAFNLELAAPARLEDAKRIAALVREGGADGIPGVRAIGLWLVAAGGAAQVSMNVERPTALAEVVAAVARHAPLARAELVGLAPRAAFEGFPSELPIPGFDPARHLIENALGRLIPRSHNPTNYASR